MPTSLHPQAKFDPIPPDLDLHGLVDRTPNFKWVQRVSRAQIRNLGQQEFEKLVQIHVIVGGMPLVIDDWDAVLPKWLFNVDWLEKTYDKKQENVRDISVAADIPMTAGHYLRSMKQLTNQWTSHTFRDERRQRLYLKDIDCPVEWRDVLQKVIHPSLFYLNENVSVTGGGGRHDDDDIFRSENTAAPAGDLMSSLPEEMRAENLMCYIGHEGTYTPAHREMCASLGQNIMVEASGDGGGEKAGSSIWFMTESKDREVVREYFLSMLGHDIEIEKHFVQINAWKKAPFDVYIVEQRVGDFILIPPLAAHQVWNRGTRTMKVAWNCTTVETLDLALHEALPKARLVCRDEQYKNKAMIYFTLQKYFGELHFLQDKAEMTQMSFMGIGHDIVRNSPRAKQLAGDFKKLFGLFAEIIIDEAFGFKEKDVEFLPFDSCVTCSYCRSNIFNRFLTCKHCIRTLMNGDEDAYDVCMECYAMGRSCACLSGLQWCEQWSWPGLVDRYESWRAMVIANDGYIDVQTSPQPFEVARLKLGKKSVAQICQEALRRRPWKDITKQERDKTPSESKQGDGDKAKKKPKKKKKGEVYRCHVCCHKDYSYRVHKCTNPECTEAYCYGVLYRAFDLMPQRVLEDEYWLCPKCLGICNCGSCRHSGNTNAYVPKKTLLGHDTRPIADDRSVEALVDFRVHNLSWLKAVGEESRSKDSRRMQRLREQADDAKAQDLPHQVEAEQAMHDDNGGAADAIDAADAAAVSDAVPGEVHAMNGYGDQSEVLGQQQPALKGYGLGEASQVDEEAAGSEKAIGSVDLSGAGEPMSSYPDPPVFVHQRIGMGYYEQDDTPDKILFDPYQAPSADLKLSEPDVPEFVKKSIRAAKRKARSENEDPDFVIGKSHHKKPRLTSAADMLDSMDPALFNNPTVPEVTTDGPVDEWGAQPSQPSGPRQGGSEGGPQKRQTIWFDANEPALRHAKPMASYVELEDVELEDVEEYEASPKAKQQSKKRESDARKEGVDEVANDDGVVFTQSPLREAAAGRAGVAWGKAHKRRGRPPKRLSTAATAVEEGSAAPTQSKAATAVGTVKRGRGRPRKWVANSGEARNADLFGDNADMEEARVVGEVEAKLAREEAAQANDEDCSSSALRQRAGQFGDTTIAAASAGMEAEGEGEGEGEGKAAAKAADETTAPRRRGRPRRSEVAEQGLSARDEGNSAASQRFISMAERHALRGKKFKIGKRKSQLSRSPDRGGSRSVSEASRSVSGAAGDDGAGQTPAWDVSATSGPTVVRLADVESEGSGGWDASSSSVMGSGDEGDIPSGRTRGSRGDRGRHAGGGDEGGRQADDEGDMLIHVPPLPWTAT